MISEMTADASAAARSARWLAFFGWGPFFLPGSAGQRPVILNPARFEGVPKLFFCGDQR